MGDLSAASANAALAPPGDWRSAESFDGTRLAWRVDGPPEAIADGGVDGDRLAVVLTNGISCDDTFWHHVWPALAETRPVVRWHFRGHGHSGPPADRDAIGVSDVARDLHTVLDAAGVRHALLVGHSYGVQVIGEAYAVDPDPIEGLLCVAGAYGTPIPTLLGRNPGVWIFEVLRGLLAPVPGRWLFKAGLRRPRFAYTAARLGGFVSTAAPPGIMADWFAHVEGLDLDLLFRMMRRMQEHTLEPALGGIDVPVTVMPGADDWPTPPRGARRMVDRLPDARLTVVPRATHVLPLEYPELVVDEVERLADRIGRLPTTGAG